jgi:hypothetical protein
MPIKNNANHGQTPGRGRCDRNLMPDTTGSPILRFLGPRLEDAAAEAEDCLTKSVTPMNAILGLRPVDVAGYRATAFWGIQTGELALQHVTYPRRIIRFRANPAVIVRNPQPAPLPPPASVQPRNDPKGRGAGTIAGHVGISGCDRDGHAAAAGRRRRASGSAAVPLAAVDHRKDTISPALGCFAPPSIMCIGFAP